VGAVAMQQTAISDDKFIPGLRRLTDRIHAVGGKIAVQLHHGGFVAAYSHGRWGHPLWGPAVPPRAAGNFTDYFLMEELAPLAGMKVPEIKVLEQEDIDLAVSQFAQGARRAKEAGFDGIEIHGGHGYLLSSFTSPYTNSRTDGYGGSVENRLRLTLEVIAAIRAEVGRDYPLWIKLDAREVGKPGGITLEMAKEAARLVEAAGVDAITVTSYHDTSIGKLHSESNIPHIEDTNLPATAEIRKVVSIPVIGSGRIEAPTADATIGKGEADFIAMGRKLLADPHLPVLLYLRQRDLHGAAVALRRQFRPQLRISGGTRPRPGGRGARRGDRRRTRRHGSGAQARRAGLQGDAVRKIGPAGRHAAVRQPRL